MALFPRTGWVFLSVTIPLCSIAVRAEDPKQAAPATAEILPGGEQATLHRWIDQAVQGIARRYNLNKEQTEATRDLWRREVESFLREHENEVWPVILDVMRQGFKNPENLLDMQRLARSAGALFEPIKEAAFHAQDEWRLILTEEQKRMHDFDLGEMETTFEKVQENLTDWAEGRATEHGLLPPKRVLTNEPSRPDRPPSGLPDPVKDVFDPSRIFDTIVKEFIKEYRLNQGQITSARSILVEFKAKANDFQASKKDEFAKIAAQLRGAHDRRDVAAVRKATAAHKAMLKPVYELTELMQDRLEALLTTVQRERYGNKSKDTSKTAVAKKSDPKKRSASKSDSPRPGAKAERGQD